MSVEGLLYWHWLALGLALLVAEVAVGGASFLMWIGFAAIGTGVLALIVPVLGWQLQMLVFGIGSVASVFLWRRFVKDRDTAEAPVLNQRDAGYIGRVVRLEEAIVDGSGRVRIDDTLWAVRGKDAPAGAAVRILARDGNLFDVMPLE